MSDKKQLNMRLTDDDLAHVELLKQHDVPLAEVIREALRQRAQALRSHKHDVVALVRELEREYPDPTPMKSAPYAGIDTTDRRAVSEFIQSKLRAKTTARGRAPDVKPLARTKKVAGRKSKRKTA